MPHIGCGMTAGPKKKTMRFLIIFLFVGAFFSFLLRVVFFINFHEDFVYLYFFCFILKKLKNHVCKTRSVPLVNYDRCEISCNKEIMIVI